MQYVRYHHHKGYLEDNYVVCDITSVLYVYPWSTVALTSDEAVYCMSGDSKPSVRPPTAARTLDRDVITFRVPLSYGEPSAIFEQSPVDSALLIDSSTLVGS